MQQSAVQACFVRAGASGAVAAAALGFHDVHDGLALASFLLPQPVNGSPDLHDQLPVGSDELKHKHKMCE